MTRALSMDLRERAMARLEKGETCRQVAAALQVGVSSVVKWSQRKRETGSCAPRAAPKPARSRRPDLAGRSCSHGPSCCLRSEKRRPRETRQGCSTPAHATP